MNAALQLQQAEVAVANLAATWPGAPPIKVVGRPRDLPFKASADCRGAFVPRTNEIFVVAGTQDASQIPDVCAHEVVAHFGLRAMFSRPAWVNFMHGVQAGARGGDWWLQQIREDVRNVYVDGSGQNYLSPVAESDEVCAFAVESRFHGSTGRLRVKDAFSARCAAALGHVQREVLYQDEPVTFRQLLGTLLESEHRLRYGGHFWGIGYRMQRWYARPMTKPWNPHRKPMSLADSEELLRADRAGEHDRSEMVFLFQALGFIASIIAFIAIIGYLAWSLVGVFAPLFR